LLDLMDIQSATQDHSLLDALAVVSKHDGMNCRMRSISALLPSGGKALLANADPDLVPSIDGRLRSASSSIWRMPCRLGSPSQTHHLQR
jgi:hypothetical protein